MSWLSELFGDDDHEEAQMRDQENQRRIAEQQRIAAQQAAEAQSRQLAQTQAAQKAAQQKANQDKRTKFLSTASRYDDNKMKATGLVDRYGLGQYYDNLLNTRAAALGDDADLSTAINPEALYTQAYNDVREGARRTATGKLNSLAPEGYGKSQFADTADDAILESILGTQYGTAKESIERAKSRGQLGDAGYTAAGTDLETTRGTARTKLEDLGLGVLGRYREGLDTERGGLLDRARNLDLGDNFDIGASITGLGQKATGYRNRMEGDIRSAAGGMDFFDVPNLLGRAATGQGMVNNRPTNPLAAAFASPDAVGEEERKRKNLRGTGNVGAF